MHKRWRGMVATIRQCTHVKVDTERQDSRQTSPGVLGIHREVHRSRKQTEITGWIKQRAADDQVRRSPP